MAYNYFSALDNQNHPDHNNHEQDEVSLDTMTMVSPSCFLSALRSQLIRLTYSDHSPDA